MIEKILKAVKSSSKKRGRNITVGAVVGMLLSCTAVMGANNYLWIRENSGAIEFNTSKTNSSNGNDGNWNTVNPYKENTWDAVTKTYINNMALSSSENNGVFNDGSSDKDLNYGLRLSGTLTGLNFINNSSITATTTTGGSYNFGIYNSGTIENITNSGSIVGVGSGNASNSGIYNSGTIGTITNSGSIVGVGSGGASSSGIYNSRTMKTITNIGSIIGTNTGTKGGDGIANYGTMDGSIINSGLIIGSSVNNNSSGIVSEVALQGSVINSGLIVGSSTGRDGSGIANYETIAENIVNSGLIIGNAGSGEGSGIYSLGTIAGSIVNSGLIIGNTESGTGYGIAVDGEATMINTGVVYGKDNAVENSSADDVDLSNYGILVNKTGYTVSGINPTSSYGLIFKVVGENAYTATATDYGKFGTIDEAAGYTIINTKAEGSSASDITGTESLELENGILTYGTSQTEEISSEKKYILNGITDTLLVSTGENKLDNSVINAYGTAVKFDETNGGNLILSGTTINGGVKADTFAILGSDDSSKTDALVLENSVVNGNIDMKDGNDELTIGAGSIANGKLDGGTGDDTLNFGSAVTRTVVNDGINIQHNISGFENMNINTNVTLFEKNYCS